MSAHSRPYGTTEIDPTRKPFGEATEFGAEPWYLAGRAGPEIQCGSFVAVGSNVAAFEDSCPAGLVLPGRLRASGTPAGSTPRGFDSIAIGWKPGEEDSEGWPAGCPHC
ncbi:MAG: hypothetical protein ACQESR_07420 [Planctomycetota bacterium]